MALSFYQCKECGLTLKNEKTPAALGCSAKTFHNWTQLGEVGDTNYSCKKCGTLVQTKSTPKALGCNAATFHDWRKL